MTAADLQALVEPLWAKRPDLLLLAKESAVGISFPDETSEITWLTGWLVSRLPPDHCLTNGGADWAVIDDSGAAHNDAAPLAALVAFFMQKPPHLSREEPK